MFCYFVVMFMKQRHLKKKKRYVTPSTVLFLVYLKEKSINRNNSKILTYHIFSTYTLIETIRYNFTLTYLWN